MNVYRAPPKVLPSEYEPANSVVMWTCEGLMLIGATWWVAELERRERATSAPCPAFVIGEQQPIRWPAMPPPAKGEQPAPANVPE